MHRLSRTVDAKQDMPGIRVRCPRAEAVALHFLRKLFQRRVRPRLMMTDKLSSSGAAEVEITPGLKRPGIFRLKTPPPERRIPPPRVIRAPEI